MGIYSNLTFIVTIAYSIPRETYHKGNKKGRKHLYIYNDLTEYIITNDLNTRRKINVSITL